jgi:hypothetical protein
MAVVRLPRRVPRLNDDAGTAVVEFIVVAVGLLVPMAYVALSAAAVQTAAFASTEAVREAGRAFSTAATPEQGTMRAQAAARLAFADHGLELPFGALALSCTEGACLAPGSVVEVDLHWSVALPWLPGSMDRDVPARIPIQATQRVPVDDYRSSQAGAS